MMKSPAIEDHPFFRPLYAAQVLVQALTLVGWCYGLAICLGGVSLTSVWLFFFVTAVAHGVTSLLLYPFWDRTPPAKFLIGLTVVLLLGLLLLGLGGSGSMRVWGVLGLYGGVVSHFPLALSRLEEAVYSPAEARTQLPHLESGHTVGVVLGALLMLLWLLWLPVTTAWWLWLGLAGALLGVSGVIYQCYSQQKKTHGHGHPPGHHCQLGTLVRHPHWRYVRPFALGTVLVWGLTVVFDFLFVQAILEHSLTLDSIGNFLLRIQDVQWESFWSLREEISTPDSFSVQSIAHLLTMFHLLFGGVTFCLQWWLIPMVLERRGTWTLWGVSTVFGGLTALSLLLGLVSSQWYKILSHILYAPHATAYHMGLYALPGNFRESYRLLIDGLAQPIGVLLGLGLLLATSPAVVGGALLVGYGVVWGLTKPAREQNIEICRASMRHADHDPHHAAVCRQIITQPDTTVAGAVGTLVRG